jgi:quercetin dioxygenase-like cupin family protein
MAAQAAARRPRGRSRRILAPARGTDEARAVRGRLTDVMPAFPPFMKHPTNRIATSSQHTAHVEGYVFDGADGSQLAFWTVDRDAVTAEHKHEFDEWFVVLEGLYVLSLDGEEVRVEPGQECFIRRGTRIAGRVTAGTRTVHAFGGRRAERTRGITPP